MLSVFKVLIIGIIISCALFILFLLCMRGRSGYADFKTLGSKPLAHRGLHDIIKPENSISAFSAAKRKGYGVEFDVHLLKDGTLAVFHDYDLKRMTGREGSTEGLTADSLREYHLKGTDDTIPTLDEVLSIFNKGETLVIELKPNGRNAVKLCRAVCDRLASYEGVYCIESFDPRCVLWFRKNRPDIVRGIIAQAPLKYRRSLGILNFFMGNLLFNFIIKPDFVAYRYSDRNRWAFKLCRSVWKIKGILWTLKDEAEQQEAERLGCLQIFEGYEP